MAMSESLSMPFLIPLATIPGRPRFNTVFQCYADAPSRLHRRNHELVRSPQQVLQTIKQRLVSTSTNYGNAKINSVGHGMQKPRNTPAGFAACKASNTPQGEPSPEEKTHRALELAQQALIKAQDSSKNVSKLPSARGRKKVQSGTFQMHSSSRVHKVWSSG